MRKFLLAGLTAPLMATSALAQHVCEYRLGRPVWHFIGHEQIVNEFEISGTEMDLVDQNGRSAGSGHFSIRNDDYNMLRESGGVITQSQEFDEDNMRGIDRQFSEEILSESKRNTSQYTPPYADDDCPEENDGKNQDDNEDGNKEQRSSISSCSFSAESIEQFARELFEFDDSMNRQSGRDASARIPYGSYLNPNWHYLRISMVQANLVYSRRLISNFFPAIHSDITFDTLGGRETATGISTQDASIYDLDRRRVRRTMALNQVILPPTPYVGGDVRADIAVVGVESYDMGRAFLRFLDDITDKVGGELLSAATPIFNIIDEGITHLAGTQRDKQFLEAGVASNWPKPRTGYWVIIWPSEDFIDATNTYQCTQPEQTDTRGIISRIIENRPGGGQPFSINDSLYIDALSPDEVILTVAYGKDGNNVRIPLDNATWALVRVEALETNPNWQRIPLVAERRQLIIQKMVDMQLQGEGASANGASDEKKETEKNENGEPVGAASDPVIKKAVLRRELDHDLSEYFGLILASTDLLAVDKAAIIASEQNAFSRHLNILESVEPRDSFIRRAYEGWREYRRLRGEAWLERLLRENCQTSRTVREELERCKGVPAPGDQAHGQDGDGAAAESGAPPEDADGSAENDGNASANIADAPILASALRAFEDFAEARRATLHLVEQDPYFAREIDFRGAESIDGEMILAAMKHPRGGDVRSAMARGLTSAVDVSWIQTSQDGLAKILQAERPKPIDLSISDRDETAFE